MKSTIIFILINVSLFNCFSQSIDSQYKKELFDSLTVYDNQIIFYGDTIKQQDILLWKQAIIQSDTLIVRLLWGFNNDLIKIYMDEKLVLEDSLTTNKSSTVAGSHLISGIESNCNELKFVTSGINQKVRFKKGYRFLDVYKYEDKFRFRFNNHFKRYN